MCFASGHSLYCIELAAAEKTKSPPVAGFCHPRKRYPLTKDPLNGSPFQFFKWEYQVLPSNFD